MKFAEKIIWSCLLTLAIVFSLGSAIMIFQNHHNLLQTTIDHHLSNHDIELYSLETRLYQDSISYATNYGVDEKMIMNRAIYYLDQFRSTSQGEKKTYAMSTSDQYVFYNNIDEHYYQYISPEYNQKYFIKHDNHQYIMMITSQVNAGQYVYFLTSCYDVTSVYQERNRQIQNFVVISIMLFVFAYFILKFISSYLTQSIDKLNTVTQRIASGDYSERTQIKSADEIGELSRSFDEMAEINEQTIHQLQESVIQKEEFMGSFSHEIKTPMTAILGFADLLRTCDCDEETRQKAAQYIYTEGKRLENLSYTLMDLLAIKSHRIELKNVSFQTIVKQLMTYYEGKKNKCLLVFGCEDITVLSQPDLLFTLMRNLIDNALKASHDGQEVVIKTSQHLSKVVVSICDEGIGMSEDDIHKATEAFYMADKSRSRLQGGAGLGLTIVKRICDVHQTALSIQSKLHHGTTVSFELEVVNDE